MSSFYESDFERALLYFLQTQLGYSTLHGADIPRLNDDYRQVVLVDRLRTTIERINPSLPAAAIEAAFSNLVELPQDQLILQNKRLHRFLQEGMAVSYVHEGEQKHEHVRLLDENKLTNNDFLAVNQWVVRGYDAQGHEVTRRPDVLIFVNGLPLVVIELKSPSDERIDPLEAYHQIQGYKEVIPQLFAYNAFCICSDMAVTKSGTISASADRFMEWKSAQGDASRLPSRAWEVHMEGLLSHARLLDVVKNFICFSEDVKILPAYHQYFAVRRALESTVQAHGTDGRAGVFWHTQGSGKSLSMVFYARQLMRSAALSNPTLVVVTDRNDLDGQLFRQFAKCGDFLCADPMQAESREHLGELLRGRRAGGIIFTTIQKFDWSSELSEDEHCLSTRRNVIVMADEAHRSQYGFRERVTEDGHRVVGAARRLRLALPHATLIGFTGTPISEKDRSTRSVFGDYVDVYDMTQAVEDGATRPVYYESRVMQLRLDEPTLQRLDALYHEAAAEGEISELDLQRSKQELGNLEAILGADETIESLCADIVAHYEDGRQYEQSGKAMIVAYSREIAMKMRARLLALRPDWASPTDDPQGGKLAVVMSSGKNDSPEWKSIIGGDAQRAALATRFKDEDVSSPCPLKVVIVVDMWLTGFDVPSLSTMYVYKPMQGHNLMQAIARVNRVYRDKEAGLVVDYIGIARALKEAMHDYTARDQLSYGEMNVEQVALKRVREALESCAHAFHGFDYRDFLSADGSDEGAYLRSQLIRDGVDYMLEQSQEASRKIPFLEASHVLARFGGLCASFLEESERGCMAYFIAVRTCLVRMEQKGGSSAAALQRLNVTISQMLRQSIKSEGVQNLFEGSGDVVNLFDPAYLQKLAGMKHKNIAVLLLEELLKDKLREYQRTNYLRAEEMSKRLKDAMKSYYQGHITSEEILNQLLGLAHEQMEQSKEGEDIGLSQEELGFYDILTRPLDKLSDDEREDMILLTRELVETLHRNRTIDWHFKEDAQAKMRRAIKRLLNRYGYPPNKRAGALADVMRQCEGALLMHD